MKVLLATRYFDLKNAGIGRVSSKIKEGLESRGIQIVSYSTDKTSLASYFKYSVFEMRKNLQEAKGKVDIYHALTPVEGIWMPPNKTVVTYYDFIPILYPERQGAGIGRSPLKGLMGKSYFSYCSRVMTRSKRLCCISEMTVDDLVKLYKPKKEKIRVVELGINEDLEPQNHKVKDYLKITIGYLGQLDKRKRVDLLIEAVKKSSIHNLHCLIAGTGVDSELLKTLGAGDPRIHFLGGLPDSLLPEFYSTLDLFVFPTWVEGYGLPMVEAMACGTPVVTLEDSIIPYEIESKTTVVDNLDTLLNSKDLIYKAILDTDLLGNYYFAKRHTWKQCIDNYIKIYEEVLS
jgi:glycosyltransferase involved in cell wall biosynthesis